MGRRKKTPQQQAQEEKAAILAAMTRKAISGDTKAAKIVLDAQRENTEATEPVKIIIDV